MSKTKNQIIQEITDATIARLTPADTPEKISDEVTQDIEGYIVLENVSRGKGYGLKIPETLPHSVTADLMAAMFPIRCVACAGLEADEKFDLLCLYQTDGPDAGTYVEGDNALYRLAIRYNRQLTKAGFNEVCRRLRGTVPRVPRTMDPDLVAVKTAVATIPISDFGKDFMLEPITRATAIIVDENDVGTFIDKAANLKATVTGDAIRINRKGLTPISYRFFGFMVQCVNEMPRFKDKSNSFYRRQLVVPFAKCFTGRERKYIKSDYLKRPEVLRYVLYRVLNMDHYELSNPAACQAVLREYQTYNDPVRQFFQDVETRFAWNALPFEFLYDLYKAWSSRYNPSGTLQGRNTFQKEIRNVAKCSTMWYPAPDRFRTKHMMDAPEPMIVEFNLTDWMNPNATASSNPDVLARTCPKDRYRGLLRYGYGPDGDKDDTGRKKS